MLPETATTSETTQAGARHGRSAAMSARIQLGGQGFWEPETVHQPATLTLPQTGALEPAPAGDASTLPSDASLRAARLLAAEVLTLRQQRDTSVRQIRALLAKVQALETALATAGVDPAA